MAMKEIHVTIHNATNCICKKCPSFPGRWRELAHADMPGLFCGHGKSKLEIEQKGCNCPKCLVQKEHELTGSYYCVNGKAAE
jgi:hypothetical protein